MLKTLVIILAIVCICSCDNQNPLIVVKVENKDLDVNGWYRYKLASGTIYQNYHEISYITQEKFEVGDTLRLVKK